MARDGSGNYSLYTGNPISTGDTSDATLFNNTMDDIATALTGSLAANGEKTATGNQPMGTYKHTGVGNSSAQTDYASAADVQKGSIVYLTSVSGTNTITATGANSMTAYTTGMKLAFIVGTTNTGAVTINVNSIGAKAITKNGSTALTGGELLADVLVVIAYDGTQFQIISNEQPLTAESGYTKISTNYYRRSNLGSTITADATANSVGSFTITPPSNSTAIEVLLWPHSDTNDTKVYSYWDSGRTQAADIAELIGVDVSNVTTGVQKILCPVVSGTCYLYSTADATNVIPYVTIGYYT